MAKKGEGVAAFLFRNWALKLVALFLGAASYLAILGATGYEVIYRLPVEVTVEPGIAILDQDNRFVDVTFRGSQEDLRRLDQRQLKIVVKPRVAETSGSETVRLDPHDVERPQGVAVAGLRPSTVKLTFDREAHKSVEVLKPVTVGMPLMGHVELDYSPKTVTLTGPGQRISGKNAVVTEPVDVDGRVASFEKRVRVLPPSDTAVSQVEPPEVTVKIRIVTDTETRQWERVPVALITEAGQGGVFHVEPEVVTVIGSGRAEIIAKIEPQSLKSFVDCRKLGSGLNFELPVEIVWPAAEGVRFEVRPPVVKVTSPPAKASPAVPEG
jgi:YbbR domain-containing protein